MSVNVIANNLTIAGGTAMSANHGNGTSLQHSDGTGASGNLASFDAAGNVIDSGVAKSSDWIKAVAAGKLIQYGITSGTSVTFPVAFSETPIIVGLAFGGSINLATASSTGCTFNSSGVASINWIAIGAK